MAYVDAAQLVRLPVDFMNVDHEEEFRLLEALGEALAAARRGDGGGLAAVLERLALLAVHTREHFLREEAAMREARYPGLPGHKAEHDRFISDLLALAREHERQGPGAFLSLKVSHWLAQWLKAHVSGTDAEMAKFLRRRRS